jgi:N6-L-threonylcarbamoyladenine synthase
MAPVKLVLGIARSCDETAAAVVSSEGDIRSDVVRSQVASFVPYGGVVPEIAARDHARLLPDVVTEAVRVAGVSLADLDGIAVTHRPGLLGALLVGLMTAKGLAWSLKKPLVGVDHLVGHLFAIYLRRGDVAPPPLPFAALLVSGGHTAIYRVDGPSLESVRELGATRDDAAGEAFDKVAKLLGLGYPGGPLLEKLARVGDPEGARLTFRPALRGGGRFEMSFSGLKSAIARHVELHGAETEQRRADVAAAFQRHAIAILVDKTIDAACSEGLSRIVLGGGVAANSALREHLVSRAGSRGLEVFVPPRESCTDNAAMIALVGAMRLARGEHDPLTLAPDTKTALATVTRKGGGPRPSARRSSKNP